MPLIKSPPPPAAGSSPEKRTVPPFAPCQRTAFSSTYKDWFTISSPHPVDNFDICPDCFNTSIKPTPYARFVTEAPPKAENVGTKCDFSDLWIRITWAWLYTQNAPDLSLLGHVAQIQDPEGQCPNLAQDAAKQEKGEKAQATRTWYCLIDPKTNALVEDMTICSDCVSHLHTMLPSLQGIFAPAADGQSVLATCDLMLPKHERTTKYLDQFLEVAEKVQERGYRDVSKLVEYVMRWAPVPVCKKWEKVSGEKAYGLNGVPEWTVCEECFMEHVRPLYDRAPQPIILAHISHPQIPPNGYNCQMYSTRLQGYFSEAVNSNSNDLSPLRLHIQARMAKLQEIKRQLEPLRLQHSQYLQQMKYHIQMSQMQQQSAMVASMAWTTSGWSRPIDFSSSSDSMNQSGQAALQADMVEQKIKLIEKEWGEEWE